MYPTPTLTFRGIKPSAALEAEVRAHVDKLATRAPSILSCRVLIELAQRRHEAGNRYHVRIDLAIPGEDIVVTHQASLHATAKDIATNATKKEDEPDPQRKHAYVAVREAFDILRRRLQDHGRRHKGTLRATAARPRGRVVQLFETDGYGYLEAEDGHEVYFQRSSVLNDMFDRLEVGSTVSFAEEPGAKGPQASTVKLSHPRRQRRTTEAPAHEPNRTVSASGDLREG